MSAGERAPLPNSLLRGTRSYGSLVQSPLSPVRQRRIEHRVQPGETLQGLALKYGVSMEQIKRANRLYTNDSIFLKKSLSIPVLSDSYSDTYSNGAAVATGDPAEDNSVNGNSASHQAIAGGEGAEGTSELSPMDFLRKMDGLISRSKQAAVKGCQESEKRFAALEAVCTSRTPDSRRLTRSQSAISSPRMHQQATLGEVSLRMTKRSQKLREREDEIFEL